MKTKHSIQLFFARMRWYIEGVYKALSFQKQIKNYAFLVKTQKALEMKLLDIKRKEKEGEAIIQLQAQIDVIKKILLYVDR